MADITNDRSRIIYNNEGQAIFGGSNAVIWVNPAAGSHAGVNFRQDGTFKGFVGFNNSSSCVNLSMDGSIADGINVNASHDVGIGTTSPDAKLHIEGSASDQKVLEISTAQLDGPYTAYKNRNSGTTTLGFIGNSQGIMNSGTTNFGVRANNDLTFSSGGATERMRIDSSGSVGIGLVSPQYSLHVLDTIGTRELKLGHGNNYARITTDDASKPLDLQINSQNALRISTAKNIGIGTDSPSQKIHIVDTNGANIILNSNTGAENNGIFMTEGAAATPLTNGVYLHYDSTNNAFKINTGTSSLTTKFTMDRDTGNVGIGVTPTASERFSVQSNLTTGVRIDQSKNISATSTFEDVLFLRNTNQSNTNVCRIGMSTSGTDGQHHRVSLIAERDTSANYRGEFSIAMRQSDATHPKRLKLDYAGNLTVSGDIIAFGSPSDKFYKENIKPITNALDKISKLEGVTFDWKESNTLLDVKNDIGFIAQDVKEVLPNLVRKNEDGKLSLRDKGIVPVLVEAIKELKAEIEELKKKIK